MVVFTCDRCNESLKKPKVQFHNCFPTTYTCCDCFKTFNATTYNAHTKCITEAERYGGQNFVAKGNKGEAKQESWVEQIQAAAAICESKKYKSNLEKLATKENLPRKEKPFKNFCKSAFHYNDKLCDEVWLVLQENLEKVKKQKEAANKESAGEKKEVVDEPVEEVEVSEKLKDKKKAKEESVEDDEGTEKVKDKKKKKKRQDEQQDIEVVETVEEVVVEKEKKKKKKRQEVEEVQEEVVEEVKEKKKKKKKRQQEEESQEEVEQIVVHEVKEKKRKEKRQEQEEEPIEEEVEEVKEKSKKKKKKRSEEEEIVEEQEEAVEPTKEKKKKRKHIDETGDGEEVEKKKSNNFSNNFHYDYSQDEEAIQTTPEPPREKDLVKGWSTRIAAVTTNDAKRNKFEKLLGIHKNGHQKVEVDPEEVKQLRENMKDMKTAMGKQFEKGQNFTHRAKGRGL